MKIWKNIKRPPILVISTWNFHHNHPNNQNTHTHTQKHLELVHEALTIKKKIQIKLEIIQNQDFLLFSICFFSFKCLYFIEVIFFVIYNHILNSLLQILLFKNLCLKTQNIMLILPFNLCIMVESLEKFQCHYDVFSNPWGAHCHLSNYYKIFTIVCKNCYFPNFEVIFSFECLWV